jgi:Arc/MetJ-type ribon-helix-helix transcriptional regulator
LLPLGSQFVETEIMKKSISVNKKSRGRPKKRGGVHPVTAVRLPPAITAEVDKWAASQAGAPTRSEAIRRLVELGLTVKPRSAPSGRQRTAIADLAAKAIDSLTSGEPDSDEKASRKRRLTKGPEEFREVRVDHRPRTKGK